MSTIRSSTPGLSGSSLSKAKMFGELHAPDTGRTSGDAELSATIDKVMGFINAQQLNDEEQRTIMLDSISNWSEHINPGFLAYRKSVAEGLGFAAIEWRDGEPGGSTVLDASGKEYIDCLGGFGIYNVGHSHPVVVEAVRAQLSKQPLHSQELLDPLRGYAAKVLSMTMPEPNSGREEDKLKYSFFTNSGTESVEACLKMAMLSTGRKHFVGLVGAFHGKTLGSLSGTSKSVFRKPFSGGLLAFSHIPVNDIESLKMVFQSAKFTGNEIAGVLIEPILGEGGIHVVSKEFLEAARGLCDEAGSMLIFDEVQSGMGRTGKMWACEWSGVTPDLMAIGKAFGGGVTAAGACIGNRRAWEKYFENPFLHTTTFGGNPMSMAAAIATFQVIRNEGLLERARYCGEYLTGKLEELKARHPAIIKEVRGRGLMLGLEFPDNDIGFTFSRGVFSKGVLLSGTLVNARTIRVEPPLTIKQEQMDTVLRIFGEVLDSMEASTAAAAASGAGSIAAPFPVTSTKVVPAAPVVIGDGRPVAAGGGNGPVAAGGGGQANGSGSAARRDSIESTDSDGTDPDPFGEGPASASTTSNGIGSTNGTHHRIRADGAGAPAAGHGRRVRLNSVAESACSASGLPGPVTASAMGSRVTSPVCSHSPSDDSDDTNDADEGSDGSGQE